MNSRLDVIGIGNAMVDAIIPSNQKEIEKNELNRNSMNLIDEELKNKLHSNYPIKKMVCKNDGKVVAMWWGLGSR